MTQSVLSSFEQEGSSYFATIRAYNEKKRIQRCHSCSDCSAIEQTRISLEESSVCFPQDVIDSIIQFLGHQEYGRLSLVSKQWQQGVFDVRKYKVLICLDRSFHDLYSLFGSEEPLSAFTNIALPQVLQAEKVEDLMRAFYACELGLCEAYLVAQKNPGFKDQKITCGPSRLIQELSQSLIRVDRWNSGRKKCRYVACAALKMVLSGHIEQGSSLMHKVSSPFLKHWVAEEVLTLFLHENRGIAALHFIAQAQSSQMQSLLQRLFRFFSRKSKSQPQEEVIRHSLMISNHAESIKMHFVARVWLIEYIDLLHVAESLFFEESFWNKVVLHALEELGICALRLGELDNALEVAVHLPESIERKRLFDAISKTIRKQVRKTQKIAL